MENRERLLAFFEAENKRNWAEYRTFLSRDVIWILHGTSEKTVRGIDAYLDVITTAYAGSEVTFSCEALYESNDKARIVAVLKNNLGERSCDIFEFSEGLIWKEHEYLLGK